MQSFTMQSEESRFLEPQRHSLRSLKSYLHYF